MAREISCKVEDRLFQQALYDLAQGTRKPFAEVIKGNGRLIGVNLAWETQPYGNGQDAKKAGEMAVRRDIKKVYAEAGSTYLFLRGRNESVAKAFYRAMLQGDWKEAQYLLRTTGSQWRNVEIKPFDPKLHKQSRNRRGRVHRLVPAQVVSTGGSKLDTYVAKKVRMVGFGKAGWAAATRRLAGNTRGIPQFVTRHKAASGSAVDNSTRILSPHVLLQNHVPYINAICGPGEIAKALRTQREKMMISIDKVLARSARKFNNAR